MASLLCGVAIAQPTTGDLLFTGFNADGNDDVALVSLVSIPSGTTIWFTDNEWDGTAFNTGEGIFSLTTTSALNAGDIITISSMGTTANTVSNVGTIAYSSTNGANLGASNEVLYAYMGTASSVTTFITAVANSGFSTSNGSLTSTGLTAGTNALEFTTGADVFLYTGARSGQTTFSAYAALVCNTSNWISEDGSGDQSANSTAPDVPFSTVAFATGTADVTAPVASAASIVNYTTTTVTLSEPVTSVTGTNTANFTFTPAVAISAVVLNTAGDEATITHASLVDGTTYTLNVSGLADAAGNTSVSTDFNFNFNGAIPALVITEIAHTPNTYEFIEIYNNGTTAVPLNGLQLANGFGGSLPNISLVAGSTVVLSSSSASATTEFGFTVYPFTGGLSSGGEAITLRNSFGQVIDTVNFGTSSPWPNSGTPTGFTGVSIELNDANNDNNDPSNWAVTTNVLTTTTGSFYGTPGVYPPVPAGPAPTANTLVNVSSTSSYVVFSTALNSTSATATANYSYSPALAISAITLSTTGDTAFITHAAYADGVEYTLTVSGVQSATNVAMAAAANFTTAFNALTSGLVITEFAHSPNTMEFIEVYNASSNPINLNGLKWTDGTTGNFPNLILAAGANILFSTNTASANSILGGTYYLINNGLGSSNDQLVIRNSLNQVIDSVDYFVGTNNWPAAPANGQYGYSFELNSATNDNNDGTNWAAPSNIIASTNGTVYGTPGVYPAAAPSTAPTVLSYAQTSATTAYVVFNQAVTSATATNVLNYVFTPSLTVSSAVLSTTADTVQLTFAASIDGQAYTVAVNNVENANGDANVAATLNLIWNASLPNLVITEIIHSPNDIESIEIYNAGTTAVELGGLRWTDGTSGNFPAVSLAAGATATFATSPSTAITTLGIAPIYPLNSGLSSSNDQLVIRNSLNQVIDTVDYFVGNNGWPTAVTGQYAYSIELNNATDDNNIGTNWTSILNPIVPTPAAGYITATPGVYPTPAYTPAQASIAFVGSKVTVDENATSVDIILTIAGNGNSTATVDLEILPISTASAGTDYALPTSMTYSFAPLANNVTDTITIPLTDDMDAENTEYIIVRLANQTGISLPAAASNHFTVLIQDNDKAAPVATNDINLNYLTSYSNGIAGPNSAEIVAHDPVSQRLFIVNSLGAKIDIVNFSNPAAPTAISSIDISSYGNINSIDVKNGVIAAAIENATPELDGSVVFFDTNGSFLKQVTAGALPDMVKFNHAGTLVLTANEGQPNGDYTIDPEGSVTIIDISGGIANLTQANVTQATFTAFNANITALETAGVRIGKSGATVAQDMEPEYITISDDDAKAYITCQENNAVAVVDLATNTIVDILPLGSKDHMLANNSLDASDQGGVIHMANWPILGTYMPDAISYFNVAGIGYFVTANEGDAREYGNYADVARLSSLTLDATAFPYADAIKANIGRINTITTEGDTDNDGDLDEIHVFGSRSFTIWNAATGARVWDSGDDFERITAVDPTFGALFNASNSNNSFKNRSDDKGPEPEGITTAVIDGKTYAFITLERTGGVMVYDISNPMAPVFVDYKNSRTTASYGGDNGPEGIILIASENSPSGSPILILANEVSSTLSIFGVEKTTSLQVLHASDFEAGLSAIDDAANFAAIVDTLENTHANTLILSSGDNMIPSPFSSSGEDPSLVTPLKNAYTAYYGQTIPNNDIRAGIARPDVSIMNFIGIEAAALGNHEFDWGTSELRNMIAGQNSGANVRWFGAQFPYLSSNLDFSQDANLSNIVENNIVPNTNFKSNPNMTASQIAQTKKLAKATIIEKNGVRYGIVGATTPTLAQISSPGATSVMNPGAGTNSMTDLASLIQPVVDSLRFTEGINKIILLAHMQQLNLEQDLATYLQGVDIIVAGGSHTLLADTNDRMRAGDAPQGQYPIITNDAEGKPVAIVNTTSEYKYVGRLVIDFDVNGNIVPSSVDAVVSGAYAADSLGVTQLWGNYTAAFAPGTKGYLVKMLTTKIDTVITSKDGNLFGKTAVYLEGRRNFVRTEETNLGNLSADANLWQAKQFDPSVAVSIKNGGGIRSAIGEVNAVGNTVSYDPPAANPSAGKAQGDISQLDIENALRFNNRLSVLNLTATNLKAILEHGVAQTAPGVTPGRFPQVAGIEFSFDENAAVNSRVQNAVLVDSVGNYIDTLVMNGAVYGNPSRTFKVVTLNFLAGGGDGYPFNSLGTGRVDLDTALASNTGNATFTVPGSEQDAFAEYMLTYHSVVPYNERDTTVDGDYRIHQIQFKTDCILNPVNLAEIQNNDTALCAGNSVNLVATPGFINYSWSTGSVNQVINAAATGVYSVEISAQNGCSKVDTVEVTVNAIPAINLGVDTAICANQSLTVNGPTAMSSYAWSNAATASSIAVTTSGYYALTVTDANNCSNSDIIQVTVNALPTVTISDATICAGNSATFTAPAGLTYAWSTAATTPAITATTAGSYSVTVTDANNCSNSDAAVLTVNALPTVTLGANQTACAGTQFTLTPGTSFASYAWSNSSNAQSITVSTGGQYSVTATDANGCQNADTAVITVLSLPTVGAGSNSAICAGNTVTLAGSGAASYVWNNSVVNATAFTPTATATYQVTGTDANGCSNTASVVVTVNALPTATISGDAAICSGDNSILSAGTFASYTWSTAQTTNPITVTTAGNYSVTVTDVNGCSNSASFAVAVNALPTFSLGNDTAICANESLILSAPSTAIQFNWSNGSTLPFVTANTTAAYSLSITDINGCSAADTVSVTVNALPVVELGNDTSICDGNTVTFDAGAGFNTYTWNTLATTQSTTAENTGIYTVTVTNAAGCEGVATITLVVNPLPLVDLGNDVTLCNLQSATLEAGAGANYTYSWSNGTANQVLTVDTSMGGTYVVTVTNTFGCSASDEVIVLAIPCAGIDEASMQNVSLYPNPATDNLNVVFETLPANCSIRMMDATGRMLVNTQLTSTTTTLQVAGFAKGIYFLQILSGNNLMATQKVMIK